MQERWDCWVGEHGMQQSRTSVVRKMEVEDDGYKCLWTMEVMVCHGTLWFSEWSEIGLPSVLRSFATCCLILRYHQDSPLGVFSSVLYGGVEVVHELLVVLVLTAEVVQNGLDISPRTGWMRFSP